jgi:uroporphyrin-III C-methyltransferase/precorrin-2 dehydrogenase/sirohydrochlorin ferrochelatase
MTSTGFVSIVGAGPGDPDLLTRKAVRRLRRADLVLYDALVDPRVIAIARRASRFYVGKRAGRHALTQDAIHALLVRAARRGLLVVRLKGGDPFVFGRGGEEALALTAAGIPFEVVPGITSAVAAPARAGIPVTHRGVSSAFLVVSGHDLSAFEAAVNGTQPDAVTLVVLMGMANRARLAASLIERGWPASTPAAVITGAWTPEEHVARCTLVELSLASDGAPDAPGTLVFGEVAALACAAVAATYESRERASAR